jgi:phosphopantetheinyl transferase
MDNRRGTKIVMQQETVLWLGTVPEYFSLRACDITTVLNAGDTRHYYRLRSQFLQQRFLYGRVLLRRALSQLSGNGIRPEQWRFTRTKFGKPVIDPAAGLPDLHFNISYDGEVVVLLVSTSCRVGVDIERVHDRQDMQITAALSRKERKTLSAFPVADRTSAALRIWTIKEAYSKLLGLGLNLDFSTLNVDLSFPPTLSDPQTLHNQVNFRLVCHAFRLQQQEYLLSIASLRGRAPHTKEQPKEKNME